MMIWEITINSIIDIVNNHRETNMSTEKTQLDYTYLTHRDN